VQVIGKDKTRNIEEQVVVHKLPYDGNTSLGMEKLQRFIKRGYTFERPKDNASVISEPMVEPRTIIPEVEEEAPLSDKPEKPKKRKSKK